MSLPIPGVVENGQSNVSVVVSAPSVDHVPQNDLGLKERNYLGLSACSSVDSNLSVESKNNLNLKATELRLGLPGSQSPERGPDLCFLIPGKLDEKPLFPLLPSKDGIGLSTTSNKRGFSDTMDGFSGAKSSVFNEKWMSSQQSVGPGKVAPNDSHERPHGTELNQTGAANSSSSGPAAKAQVIGWPPIRSFRKNTLASSSKIADEVDGKPGLGSLFVKVSMDGAPYLRKVDLRNYSTYRDLSSALEKMFSCFTLGQCGSHGAPGREMLSESKLRDLLHGSEYVLTYEDKDKDWMLVGDVPWEMFIDSCQRLKIMKGSDAIGLAPRAMEKSKNRN